MKNKREIFLPGDTEEINDFCQSSKYYSHMILYIYIPNIKIVLESKELYEIIYNRLNGDLFMWEPRVNLLRNTDNSNIIHDNIPKRKEDILQYSKHVYINLSDEKDSTSTESSKYDKATLKEVNNMFSFELCVKEGIFIMYPEIPEFEKRDQTSTKGKLQLNLKELSCFFVTGCNNDKNLSYLCVQINDADILHCGQIIEEYTSVWSDGLDKNLKRIIFKKSRDCNKINNRHEMISVVAELKKHPFNRLKRTKLAFGINGAILLHLPAKAAFNWIYQLIDFVNIADFPIEEYEPYAVVSEIQGHIWNFAIDYRPKHFPYRASLDISYGSLSSNITYPMTGCTLRVMTEDCILSIGPAENGYKDCFNNNLLAVLNVGLINISIFLNDQNTLYPKINLRSSIHDVHLKTCFDSANALAQLIAYIANDKDLISTEQNMDKNKSDNYQSKSSDSKGDRTSQHINTLMADAVKDVESNLSTHTSSMEKYRKNMFSEDDARLKTSSCSCFSNSDEGNILKLESNRLLKPCNQDNLEKSLPQIESELGTATFMHKSTVEEKDFHVIHEDELFFMDNFGVDEVFVSEDPLRIVDNHFSMPHEKVDLLRSPISFPISEESYTLCEMTFTWHLFGGKDFPDPEIKSTKQFSAVPKMSDTYKHGVSEAPNESHENMRKIIPDASVLSQRNPDVLVEIQLTKIRISHDTYPINAAYSSRQVLIISEIEIRDRLKSSEINKLLYHPFINNISHKNSENMITVKALNSRSNANKSRAEECSLKVSILPIRLNIDQDTLIFLEEYFSALIEASKIVEYSCNNLDLDRDVPIMTVEVNPSVVNDLKSTNASDKDVADPFEKIALNAKELEEGTNLNEPIYFKEFIFSPSLPICFDYHGRRIELSRGPITGLVMGLAQLQGSGINLREVICRRGLLGWNKLIEFLCREWLKDIKRNQLPNILSGIGPTNAVLQLFQGFFDLFRLPLQQYNKDGRIIKGFQLGAQSFSARTAIAALEITSRIIHLLQFTAETTFDMLSAGPSLNRRKKPKVGKKRHSRPKDLREGVANAYTIVKEGINETANTLMEAAVVEHDQKGYSGAVGAVVRQIPQLVVCPAVLATQATTNILGGAKSSLVPEAKREAKNKWKYEKN
ncbi:autophagy-related protein 2 homolog B isoform X4 [Drosophila sulfurigaster albostrigata]|uniref:autophagy-related protein 2 homolog B isoform X4 n=1 Tax=Drosophila sulfurigaster albostrigata TaxID=89887 RepID=UPI002D21A67C|nr:autophagy-related protein 2 homolog B isoform X4 [Drosophila sulfurigaster albostrigata]